MARATLATSVATKMVAYLEQHGPRTTAQLYAAFAPMDITSGRLHTLLFNRSNAKRGDLRKEGRMWHAVPEDERPRPAPRPWNITTSLKRKRAAMTAPKPGADPSATLTRRDTSWCKLATPRGYMPQGTYQPPPTLRRAGADDYKHIPSRAGDQLLPFRHP